MQTTSDTRLGRIELADNGSFCEVRLRRNIRKEVEEEAEVWRADEVMGKLPLGTTTAYVDANFDALWDEWDDVPVLQRVREIAASSTTPMAPAERDVAVDNHAVGTYLVHDGTLCKVTSPIARGETIAIGTNVAVTTVAAELLAMQE